ncbi:MAG: tRNA (adenosine(37)-N6)-dimethylallyltransferase MiaA [Desulfobacula sp.]|nr:tRNA (adenosine(37)-N6)-dimethylallyltransferase MiaA [Desulfobacula sp.]
MEKIIVICGPTGIGKTLFAIKIAELFNGEIVSADSMQIYKLLNIGTAKPDSNELKLATHHLIDFMDPKDDFDAGMYVKNADAAIASIVDRKKTPIVAGGTGLYIKALLHGLLRSKPLNEKTMSKLYNEHKEKGNFVLHERLSECDPDAAGSIHPNDSFRTMRALEFFLTNNQKISDWQKQHNFDDQRYNFIKIGLYMDREKLYERINKRVDIMLNQGLLKEVTTLIENGYSLNLKSMQSIGYKHMGMFINNTIDWDEAVRLLKRDTRRYAKRQLTWFKKDKQITWVKPSEIVKVNQLIKDFLT